MKTTIKLSFFLYIIIITSSCFPAKKLPDNTIVLPLSDTVTLRDAGIIYALPRTVFTFVVQMERTIEKPGPYSQYASDMLGLNNVIRAESESWEITSINLKSSEEADPSEFYVLSSNNLFQTNIFALKKEGLILDLNPSNYHTDIEKNGYSETDYNEFHEFDLGSDEYYQVQRDTAYKRTSIDSTFIKIPYIVEKKRKLTVDQLADKAAKRLMEIREGKHLILTGEANVYPQNDAPINEINRMEKEYTELFTGKSLKEKRMFTFQVIPDKKMVGKPVTLFQFSEATGTIADAMKQGKPVKVEFIPEKKTKDLTYIKSPQIGSTSQKYDKIFYRVPDVVNIKVSFGTEQLLDSRRLIYQFGEIIQLPANYILGK